MPVSPSTAAFVDNSGSDILVTPATPLPATLSSSAGTAVATVTSLTDAQSNATGGAALSVYARNAVYNGATWDRQRGDTSGTYVVATPTATAANATPYSALTAVNSALVLKAAPGNLYGFNVVSGASAGFLMVFDATSAPADGAVTPKLVIPMAANSGLDRAYSLPISFAVGITLVFSTTGPFTKTASATAFMSGAAV